MSPRDAYHRAQDHDPDWIPEEEPERVLSLRAPGSGAPRNAIPTTPVADVPALVERVRVVQEGWASLESADRFRRLRRLREVLFHRGDEVVDSVVLETGKPHQEAWMEVAVVVEHLRFLERHGPRLLQEQKVGTGWFFWKSAHLLREPLGVVGIISPWNYPFVLPMDPVAAALYAGNGVILKPSEHTPSTGLLISGLLEEAGLPPGLVEVVVGDGELGEAVVLGGVDKVFFTGGSDTGRRVMAAAARRLVPVSLELGGKDPAVVLEDADLERAARGIAFGAFFNAGQTCVSTERVLVVDSVHDRLVELLAEEVAALRVGVERGRSDMGPMVLPSQLEVVERQLSQAVEEGARIVTGGSRLDPASNLFRPTLLTHVKSHMAVAQEETFGPLLPVIRVRDEEEAIQVVNASRYGLFASVWTRDADRGRKVALRLRAGGVSVNDTLSHYGVAGLPTGGVGDSGFGRARGREGLWEMTRTRSLFMDRSGFRREMWWFPYTPRSERAMSAMALMRARGGLSGVWTGIRRFLGLDPSRPQSEEEFRGGGG
ncbi:MAG: aldehyde dehydrogenase family protein [Gemmatimonadota bacterium]